MNTNDIKRNYYAVIPANIRYDKEVTPNAKLLYGEITALCNEKGYCWATNDYFSKLYNVSKQSISAWISNLANKGYINVELVYKVNSKEIQQRNIYITPIKENFNTYKRNLEYPIKENFNTPIKENFKDNNTVFNNTINNSCSSIYEFAESEFGRTITSIEIELLSEWQQDFSPEMIKEAIKICVINRKNSFSYLRGILNNWKSNNIKTIGDIPKTKENKEEEEEPIELGELKDYNWFDE